jgi:hypothetical protein
MSPISSSSSSSFFFFYFFFFFMLLGNICEPPYEASSILSGCKYSTQEI